MSSPPSQRAAAIDPASHLAAIHVDEAILELPVTREILSRADEDLAIHVIPAGSAPVLAASTPRTAMTTGKRHLHLCRNRGAFFKPCPGTREYRCCDYQVLNIGMNCPMDCVYCILQAYLNTPYLSYFVNTDDLLVELETAFRREPSRFWRIGTGEFTDSMALDSLTGLSRTLVEFMRDKPQAVLELKTKSVQIANLEGLDHQGRTIVSWSLNSPVIAAQEELRTATLDQRLAAAAQCAAWGYRVAFHFDPLILHPDWQQGYAETVKRLYDVVPAAQIAWISMGALRFLPALKNIATSRFPGSRFFHEEFVLGLDGKYRYFRTVRMAMYRHLYQLLAERADPATCIYLCMESDEIWQDAMGFVPDRFGGLGAMLDQAARGN